MSDERAIWGAIDECNAAWLEGRPRETASLFADDAVLIAPGLAGRIEGCMAIVESYVEYVAAVRTLAFEITARALDVFGDTAVATYRFAVRYELEGAVHDEDGQEVLVFRRGSDGWKAVWRTQTTLRGERE